jgi:hypothetical protein
MKPRPTITVRRSDVPRWVPSLTGEVYLEDWRFAWLIGGRPRTIAIRPGRRLLRVRLPIGYPRMEAMRPIEVEEGRSYRFECGVTVEDLGRARVPLLVFAIATGLAGGMVLIGIPLLRWPGRALLGRLYLNMPGVGNGFFLLLDRLITVLTEPTFAMFLAGIAFFVTLRIAHAASPRRLVAYLCEEEPEVPSGKPACLGPGAIVEGSSALWDPIHDPAASSRIQAR